MSTLTDLIVVSSMGGNASSPPGDPFEEELPSLARLPIPPGAGGVVFVGGRLRQEPMNMHVILHVTILCSVCIELVSMQF